jgi:aldose sugar dehydrogenase
MRTFVVNRLLLVILLQSIVCALAYGQSQQNGEGPTPAFGGQTRAPSPPSSRYKVETVTSDLTQPWSLSFLPDGRMLISERQGRLRILDQGGRFSQPIAGLPPVRSIGASGFHDVALDRDFETNRVLYFSYYAPPNGEPGGPVPRPIYAQWQALPAAERQAHPFGLERVGRARLSEDEKTLESVEVLLEVGRRRLLAAPDGTLFVTSASGNPREVPPPEVAQHPDTLLGKIVRINTDGSVPNDNPWNGRTDVLPQIFAFGFKDVEGIAVNPRTGDIWMTDHGPLGGDEINILRAGKNYGYPVVSYGVQHSGQPIGDGSHAKEGMEQPVYFWAPASIAPSGMLFYTGDLFPEWRGDLFVGAMEGKFLARLVLDGDKVAAEEQLLREIDQRIRDVRQGPDGAVYVLTAEDEGRLLRLTPER